MALIPLIHRVIVKPMDVAEADETIRRARAAGIHVELDKREQAAVEVGFIISIGDTAFRDYNTSTIPVVGDKIYYAKYAGKKVMDGEESYLALNDEDIVAIITKE